MNAPRLQTFTTRRDLNIFQALALLEKEHPRLYCVVAAHAGLDTNPVPFQMIGERLGVTAARAMQLNVRAKRYLNNWMGRTPKW